MNDAQPEPAIDRARTRPDAGPLVEVAASVATILFCAIVLGRLAGWQGPPKLATSTRVWPFYLDTWFPVTVWSGRVLVPLAGLALALRPLRRFLDGKGDRATSFTALALAAWVVHFGCGLVRFGLARGLTHTFSRTLQEYWGDVALVGPGFLARFPDVGARLSQHGATHPPGLILLLAAIKALGFTDAVDAELACSAFAVLAAVPLYAAARRLEGDDVARFAVPLYLFAGSVVAFAVLAMDVVSLLLATTALFGLAVALTAAPRDDHDRQRAAPFLGALVLGLAYAAASFCTFTVLLAALSYLVLVLDHLAGASRRLRTDERPRDRLLVLAAAPLAFAAFYAVLALGFGYRPLHVLRSDLAAFAASDDARRSYARSLLGNPIAFLGSLGLPLMGLAARAAFGAALRLRRDPRTAALVLAAIVAPLAATALGKPRAEVERIYLPFVPLVVLAAAAAARRWYARSDRWLTRFAVPALVTRTTRTPNPIPSSTRRHSAWCRYASGSRIPTITRSSASVNFSCAHGSVVMSLISKSPPGASASRSRSSTGTWSSAGM